jgi:hypothetical protein
MAAGWITQINNFSDSPFVVRTNDQTWRPVINNQQFAADMPIDVPPRRTSATFVPVPFFPGGGVTIPPGPTTLNVQYMMIGWIDFARTRIQGPGGAIELTIGPKPPSGNDFLRFFDDQQVEQAQTVEIGPRGPGWVASIDFHLNFYNPTPDPGQPADYPTGARMLWWSQQGVGANLLERMDKALTDVWKALTGTLFKK